MTNPKPRHHGRDHLPGGEDPIPNWPTGGTPSVATFYRSENAGDADLLVPASFMGTTPIPWLHAKLPSDGSVSGPDAIASTVITFNIPCITIEWLFTQWDHPNYLKAAVIGTDSRIQESDQYALGTAGVGSSTAHSSYGDSTQYSRPNAHIAGDTVHCYAENGDSSDHYLIAAYLVIYIWPAPGYTGLIPGWPA